jgi:hypothetical protein
VIKTATVCHKNNLTTIFFLNLISCGEIIQLLTFACCRLDGFHVTELFEENVLSEKVFLSLRSRSEALKSSFCITSASLRCQLGSCELVNKELPSRDLPLIIMQNLMNFALQFDCFMSRVEIVLTKISLS